MACDKVSTFAGYLTLVKFHLLLENSDWCTYRKFTRKHVSGRIYVIGIEGEASKTVSKERQMMEKTFKFK